MFGYRTVVALLSFVVLGTVQLRAVEEIDAASDEKGGFAAAEAAIKTFDLPQGFKCEVAATEPLFGNAVAFSIDEKGRFYIAETFRLGQGVPDIRGRMSWLDTELASKSVDERIAYTRRLEPNNEKWWTNFSDRVQLIWDSDGDGKFDKSSVFADGFNGLPEGIASGVLAHHGNVYFTDIPHLWLLKDTKGKNVADVRKSLSNGYGVRYGFIGHDLHGLIIGPDGRLYFSIGDRGAHVTLPNGKVIDNSESGAVYRCNLDGSDLELFHVGLRNPQELAFDDYGNLWTCDNNSDAGDPARVVYVVEGGDSGWRVGWQFIERPMARSSWLDERLCYENFPDRAAYALPPVSSKVGNGPSGLAYDPGVGLPPEWRGRFFLANFSGNRNSGILAFKVKPQGAGFALDRNDRFWWNFLPTDVDFGYDGCIYATDWINGWGGASGAGKGRLYRLYRPEIRSQASVRGMQQLMAEGLEKRPLDLLAKLLAHEDRRVRQEAQFALVTRKGIAELSEVAVHGPTLLARLHAIWGLGHLERNGVRVELKELLTDPQAEIRAQTAKILGDAKDERFEKQIIKLLSDSEPRVRYFAAMTLSKFGGRKHVAPVLGMLRKSGDDPWLRHAGMMVLRSCAEEPELTTLAKDPSIEVRLAAVVALRNNASPKLEAFLADQSPRVVAEAARAINDLPVETALPALAALADSAEKFGQLPARIKEDPTPRNAILRRMVNANRRVGSLTSQLRLAGMVANDKLPEEIRVEAMTAFNDWAQPDGKDRVTGLWRPIASRSEPDYDGLESVLARVLKGSAPSGVKKELLATATLLHWRHLGEPAFELFKNAKTPIKVRVAAMEFLASVESPHMEEVVTMASASSSDEMRLAAVKRATKTMHGEQLSRVLSKLLDKGTLSERQGAYALLGDLKDPAADTLLSQRLDDLLLGQIPSDVQLDLLDAAAKRSDATVKTKLGQYRTRQRGRTGAAQYGECLTGGNAENGKKIFREHIQAQCLRCHKIAGEGGDAAPDLTKIGSRSDRNYILESITFPNAKIATGFENVQVVLSDGRSAAGVVKRDTDTELDLYSMEDGLVTITKSEIKTRTKTLSGMPDNMRQMLNRREIRDLVEYLSGLR